MSILKKAKNTIKRYNLIKKGDSIVVGVSGGADSVALLSLLKNLSKDLQLKLHIAHLDHMLRPDSGKDREFVQKLSQSWKLPASFSQIDLKKLAKNGGSLEEIARNARLDFFFQVAKKVKTKKIALGHNLDDQAETVLMRILRGSGLYGLSAILPKRKISGYDIIRPLIEVKRKEINTYLKRIKIKPRIDKTNLEDLYFRNKLRNKLLPLLAREYNQNIKEVLSNMAESVAYDYDYLQKRAVLTMKKSRGKISLESWLKLHPAMRRLVLRLEITKVKGNTRRIIYKHMKEMEDLILNRPVNSIVDLPQGISVIKKQKGISFYSRQ